MPTVALGTTVRIRSDVWVGQDGETPTDPDSVSCEVSIDDPIVGTSHTVPVHATATGVSVAKLTPDDVTGTLAPYRVKWTATVDGDAQQQTSELSVAGGVITTVAKVRDQDRSALSADRFPTVEVARKIAEFHRKAESYCGRSFVERRSFHPVTGNGTAGIAVDDLPRDIIGIDGATLDGVEVDGAAFTIGKLGQVCRVDGDAFPKGPGVLLVRYGMTTPIDVEEACNLWCETNLLEDRSNRVNQRSTSINTEEGTFSISVAGRRADTPTGLPEVDEVLARYRRRTVAIA